MTTLGEGGTPLVELPHLAAELGVKRLWVKLEFLAPTGSFKDRGSAVLISMAKEHGVTDFIEDSSGNAGASLSAYAATAGLNAHVFAPASAGQGKKDQIRVFGAELHEIDGPRQASTDAAVAFVEERGLPWLSHNLSPYFMEGMKAFAYEVRTSAAVNVDHIVFPVGNGSLIGGAFKGYSEMRESGVIHALPKLHAVQASAIQPIVALLNGDAWTPDTSATSVASGISVTRPPRLNEIVEFVRCSYGSGVAVGEDEILAWQRRLASTSGIFAEATSAAAFVGLEALIANGVIGAGDEVLIPLTGSGLKEPLP
ncbi:MAG: threonine synthase [Chloroflexi bacterium]|nr:threonine synthase [Chloroflexota bacterium]